MQVPELEQRRHRYDDGRMTVWLRFSRLDQPHESEHYKHALALFLDCAAQGAFCEPGLEPRAWHGPHPIAQQRTGEGLMLSAPTEQFDDRALQVLRNLLLAAATGGDKDTDEDSTAEDRIEAILVDLPEAAYGPQGERRLAFIVDEDNEDEEYPQASHRIGFECLQEEVDDTRVRRCVLDMTEPVTGADVDHVETWVAPWFAMLEAGGYALPVGLPGEVQSTAGGVAQFDEFSIEVSVMRFEACDMAWNALLNMLSAGRGRTAPIVRVVMD